MTGTQKKVANLFADKLDFKPRPINRAKDHYILKGINQEEAITINYKCMCIKYLSIQRHKRNIKRHEKSSTNTTAVGKLNSPLSQIDHVDRASMKKYQN